QVKHMKEFSLRMNNERGFFLPFVLVITIIIFSTVTTVTLIYQNERKISYQLWEQMKAETLVQMSKYTFLQEGKYEEQINGTSFYTFPSGDVSVTYSRSAEQEYILLLDITTDNNENFKIKTIVLN